MAAITFSREIGSDGDVLALRAAEALGYCLVGKDQIAEILRQYGLVEFDSAHERLPGFWERFNAQREQYRHQIVRMLNQIVPAVARHGRTVIVGRGGFAILQGYADVLHVRVQAPVALRAQRLAALEGLTVPEAEARLLEEDKGRAAFLESYYRVRWTDATLFDLVVNTGKVTTEAAVSWIVEAARRLEAGPPPGPTTADLQVDPILARTVAEVLARPRA
ncbi:MAG: cytidylate kinase-like family protein [Caldilineales bacterium]|nr:cytidylate kinase-like family protein [Caldilineales bacterium]MDW8317699.1 cytidylate kinase-like family protein [Anaerolineae bacterium]